MGLIGRKEFAVATFGPYQKTFVVHVAAFCSGSDIYPFYRDQLASLLANNAFTATLSEYTDFADVSSPESVAKLPEHTGINNIFIDLVDGKQSPYKSIYSLGPVKLETIKTYIETNVANSFIRAFKSPTEASILLI